MTKLSTVRFHLKVPTSEEESSKEEACLTQTMATSLFKLKVQFRKILASSTFLCISKIQSWLINCLSIQAHVHIDFISKASWPILIS